MSSEPVIVDRAAQPYVAVRGLVTMQTFYKIADRSPKPFRATARCSAPNFRPGDTRR